jgi:hypothetical protein
MGRPPISKKGAMTDAERQRRHRRKVRRAAAAEAKRAREAAKRQAASAPASDQAADADGAAGATLADVADAIARHIEAKLKQAPHVSIEDVVAAIERRFGVTRVQARQDERADTGVRFAENAAATAGLAGGRQSARAPAAEVAGSAMAALAVITLLLKLLVAKEIVPVLDVIDLLSGLISDIDRKVQELSPNDLERLVLRNSQSNLRSLTSTIEIFGIIMGKYKPQPDES